LVNTVICHADLCT